MVEMKIALVLITATVAGLAGTAEGQGKSPSFPAQWHYSLDAQGRCHAPNGELIDRAKCENAMKSSPQPSTTTGAQECKSGKLCGNTCIPANETCHTH
jgi:hypothetical protein